MGSPISLLLLVAVLIWGAGRLPAGSRLWTSTDGRFIGAELVDVLNGEAVLAVSGQAAPVRVSFARLGGTDQDYIRTWKKPKAVPGTGAAEKSAGDITQLPEVELDAAGFPIGKNSTVKRDPNGWPEVVALKERPSFAVVKEDKETKEFIYRSDHFEFLSTQRLSGEIV